ncbi:ectonucleoside triphosphate diphosphohydrolase 6 isoform X3 [Phocoena sinus]|uniref:ectonucleoside triphosphate diphosphohydrolase 6 isoform X3 n=1 Tax=Phocoena sinus TaxID=42100 RepID=UPI0013C3E58D|nr:ectonucleoside triphosphate diphosphohydrolase 6 isoform X3 [Phocoena sinus]
MRKVPNSGNLRVTKVAYPLGLFVCLFICVAYIKWHWASAPQAFLGIPEVATGARRGQQSRSRPGTAARGPEVFYGIMFDAGSTGTRVHVFQFSQQPGETPTLTHETFKALKPGLSAYADDVDKVKEVFEASPFLVGADCVSIMNGTDEGVSAWITVNFLTGSLKTPGRSNVGMLDLGGGSTQITFLPRFEDTLQTSPPGFLTSLQMFNRTYRLYSYSYLGLGLMSARLAVLGGEEGKPAEDGAELVSPCLSPGFRGEWEHAEVTYRVSGQEAAGSLYQLCARRVSEILRNKVHRTEEVKDVDFYAFSYYYDLAANVGLIDAEKGGSLVVGDFETAAKYGDLNSPECPRRFTIARDPCTAASSVGDGELSPGVCPVAATPPTPPWPGVRAACRFCSLVAFPSCGSKGLNAVCFSIERPSLPPVRKGFLKIVLITSGFVSQTPARKGSEQRLWCAGRRRPSRRAAPSCAWISPTSARCFTDSASRGTKC